MFRILADYILTIITGIVAVATIYGFFEKFFPLLSQDARFAVGFIIFLFAIFFFNYTRVKIKWGRKSKYADTMSNITSGFSAIHQLERADEINIDAAVNASKTLCNEIATAYTVITGTKCSASIKLLEKDVDELGNIRAKAITFARSNSPIRNPKDNNIKHWIDKNTDFLNIMEKIDEPRKYYFFNNNLPMKPRYQNTSFDIYDNPNIERNIVMNYIKWPLPYKSTIVVPICPCNEPNKNTLVGFLCLDSANLWAFKKKYDVELLTGLADGIYNLMKEVSEL